LFWPGAQANKRQLDQFYTSLLFALTKTVVNGHLPSTGQTIDKLLDIYAPRLSRAQTQAVPMAFKRFWQACFATVDVETMSEDAVAFLSDVLSAVPGMIDVCGLDMDASVSTVSHSHDLSGLR
jgi:hypothetical protein